MQKQLEEKTKGILQIGGRCAEHIWTENGWVRRVNPEYEETEKVAIAGVINGKYFSADTTEEASVDMDLAYLPGTTTIYCRIGEEEYVSNMDGEDGTLQFALYAVGEHTEVMGCFDSKKRELGVAGVMISRDPRKALKLQNIFRVMINTKWEVGR